MITGDHDGYFNVIVNYYGTCLHILCFKKKWKSSSNFPFKYICDNVKFALLQTDFYS